MAVGWNWTRQNEFTGPWLGVGEHSYAGSPPHLLSVARSSDCLSSRPWFRNHSLIQGSLLTEGCGSQLGAGRIQEQLDFLGCWEVTQVLRREAAERTAAKAGTVWTRK